MTDPIDLFPRPPSDAAGLRALLDRDDVLIAPGCFDGLSARLAQAAGHDALFVSGFAVAASRLGLPDVGLLGAAESLDQLRSIRAATSLPIIADADTGYGNPVNAQRTLATFAAAGAQCVMIEDQQWPKRCGHTAGKVIVDRAEAIARVRACVDARERHELDVVIMARTDANATDGFDEALWRCEAFVDAGADVTFLEAPRTHDEMVRYCDAVPGWKTANLVDDGKTPWLTPAELSEVGYSVAFYPVALLLSATAAIQRRAESLLEGRSTDRDRVAFDEVRSIVGWPDYEHRDHRLAE